jgi:hypothetical protein
MNAAVTGKDVTRPQRNQSTLGKKLLMGTADEVPNGN